VICKEDVPKFSRLVSCVCKVDMHEEATVVCNLERHYVRGACSASHYLKGNLYVGAFINPQSMEDIPFANISKHRLGPMLISLLSSLSRDHSIR
jgi:hypothetical protein